MKKYKDIFFVFRSISYKKYKQKTVLSSNGEIRILSYGTEEKMKK